MTRQRRRGDQGFTLIEVMIVVVVLGILVALAYPSYREHIVRSNREAVKSELIELAALQEKIFLNSDAYSSSVTAAYNGTAAGGLGRAAGVVGNGKYTLSLVAAGQSYTLTATPVAGSNQEGDGTLSIASDGRRKLGAKAW